ncbi:hypothetical protein [Collinsella sp. An2]|uniref:MarR family winged helix-turn-helix transcriptional regulator n=1 Tax=Collinsella sp. An2 TaxID=1965585 RepID=UPI00194FA631|nr:hypothetical protein [Collinsella sp. An2]
MGDARIEEDELNERSEQDTQASSRLQRDASTAQTAAHDAAQTDAGPRELDYLYSEIERLYHVFAHGCGVSDCAYWMLYDLQVGGGSLPVTTLTTSWAYSKQTINSALKTLEARGLVTLDFVEGSRKSKVATFTDAGRLFAQERIIPAVEAEDRAFATLSIQERKTLVRLVKRYVDALDVEIGAASERIAHADEQRKADVVKASRGLWPEGRTCGAES